MRAQILSYSRTRGLFAGVTLNGSTINQDRDANERFYGSGYDRQIVFDGMGGSTDAANAWKATLTKYAKVGLRLQDRLGPRPDTFGAPAR
jgi:lipid-binding SYLF domain-containing protein